MSFIIFYFFVFLLDHFLTTESPRSDQLVCSGPSSGMPLLAKLGLLNTVEVSESNVDNTPSRGNPSTSLGLAAAVTATGDFFSLIVQRCPLDILNRLIRLHVEDTCASFNSHNLSTSIYLLKPCLPQLFTSLYIMLHPSWRFASRLALLH